MKSTSNDRFLRRFSWQFFIYCQKTTDRKPPKKIMIDLGWNRDLKSNKPKDYGDFLNVHIVNGDLLDWLRKIIHMSRSCQGLTRKIGDHKKQVEIKDI